MIDFPLLDRAVRRHPVLLRNARAIAALGLARITWRPCPSVMASVITEYRLLHTEATKVAQYRALARIGAIMEGAA